MSKQVVHTDNLHEAVVQFSNLVRDDIRKNYTQYEIAKVSGISQSPIWRVLSTKNKHWSQRNGFVGRSGFRAIS